MTKLQTKACILLVIDRIKKVLGNMPDGEEKEELRETVKLLESIVE